MAGKAAILGLYLLLTVPVGSFAQGLAFGIKTGVPANGVVFASTAGSQQSQPIRPLAGVSVEIPLRHGFAVEVDAVFRSLQYGSETKSIGLPSPGNSSSPTTINTWNMTGSEVEFPMLLKKYFGSRTSVRGFVDGGLIPRHLSLESAHQSSTMGGSSGAVISVSPKNIGNTTHFRVGVGLGSGLDLPLHSIHLVPEVRLINWLDEENIETEGSFRTKKLSPQFLLGVSYRW